MALTVAQYQWHT